MHNIEVVLPELQDNFLSGLWKTDEFKKLFNQHHFFQALRKKLKDAPIFFFHSGSEKARNHLTSIFRFIAYREYTNPYIQDLYYFHELCHCAQYQASEFPKYEDWARKLSANELYASLMSEAFIYFMDNTLLDKTFNNLWVTRFMDVEEKSKDVNGFFINNHDMIYQQTLENELWNPFNLNGVWPQSIQNIVKERQRLRTLSSTDGLDEASAIIVNYNNAHELWIKKWKAHYITIDSLLIGLLKKVLTPQDYVDIILENCDEYGRPFYPKTRNKFSV